MKNRGFTRVYLLSHFLWAVVFAADCPFKECSCGQTDIMCNNLGLSAMPQKTIKKNMYFTSAQFDRNNITVITAGSIPANLTDISFGENPITTVEDEAFDESADTLKSLTFAYARLIRIPDAIGHLNAITFLSISHCDIQDWNEAAMTHIGVTLQTLAIDNNHMSAWPTWLQHLTNLTDLSISGCSIKDIPDNGLDTQINVLTDLSLDNNSLTTIPKAVSKLTSLTLLALDKNKIADIKWLPQSSKLKSLALNNNKIKDAKQLSTLLRIHADTLVDFDIQDNLLTSFPDLDFLTRIYDLDFNKNKIVDPNSGSLPAGLSQLKMEHNSLPRIPRFLSSLRQISQLYLGTNVITVLEGTSFPPFAHGAELQFNLIKELTDTSFPVNANITYILLNNNPLATISDNSFKNLPHLVELNLQYTKLTRLPLALSFLPKIDVFDIRNTDSLICTCLEKSLKNWILLLEADRVKGNCGQSSILYFYTELSSDCP